jgi:hypothetical protein
MSAAQDLVRALKAGLKAAGITYAEIGRQLGMAASGLMRILARGDEVLRVLKLDFAKLARMLAHAQPLRQELTHGQEAAVVADRKRLLVAICALSRWPFEQIASTYTIGEAGCVRLPLRLDRFGIVELRPLNRCRLRVANAFGWRPDGPVMRYFRVHVVDDYLCGRFDSEGEMLMLVHGQIGRSMAAGFVERLRCAAQGFAQQHLADQKLPPVQRRAYTLVIGMRSWPFAAIRELRRNPDAP